MKTISTTEARKKISELVTVVRETGAVVAIGRRDVPEVILMKYPRTYSALVNDITNVNAYSESFSFLKDEPDLYSIRDLKRRYV